MPLPRPSRISDSARSWPLLAVASALLWSYWPSLLSLQATWSSDPRYSHGFLVPLFSLYLLRSRCGLPSGTVPRPSPWGALLIGLGIAMHVAGAVTNYEWVESASLLPSLAGLCVLGWGWGALRAAWAPIAFLVFMIPLPYSVELALGGPLQRLATHASAILLQVAGLPALEQGNTINLGHEKIGIVEACNGLSMLTFFFAISGGLALCTRRPLAERALIIAGSIPIALSANVARITATALLIEGVGHGVAGLDFHDLAGYLMMPFALGLLYAENEVIARLFRDAAAPEAGASDGVARPIPPGASDQARSPHQPAGLLTGG